MRRLFLPVLLIVFLVTLASPAQAKSDKQARGACVALGMLEGQSQDVSFALWNETQAFAFRELRKIKGQLPVSAWNDFKSYTITDGLVAWCTAEYPVFYQRGYKIGKQTSP